MARRHLPVVQASPAGEREAEHRSPVRWVAVVALLSVVLWMPALVFVPALGRWLLARGTPPAVAAVAPTLASLALACALAGAVAGRFGGRAGVGEAAMGGLWASLLAVALGALGGAFVGWAEAGSALVALAGVGLGAGAAGGWTGRRWRRLRGASLPP